MGLDGSDGTMGLDGSDGTMGLDGSDWTMGLDGSDWIILDGSDWTMMGHSPVVVSRETLYTEALRSKPLVYPVVLEGWFQSTGRGERGLCPGEKSE